MGLTLPANLEDMERRWRRGRGALASLRAGLANILATFLVLQDIKIFLAVQNMGDKVNVRFPVVFKKKLIIDLLEKVLFLFTISVSASFSHGQRR